MSGFNQFQSSADQDVKTDFITGWFPGTSQQWLSWIKPRNKTWLSITCIGPGGNGGTGVIGANSTAAGGGSGASGGFSRIIVPLFQLPDTLYYSIPAFNAGAGMRTVVSFEPVDSITTTLCYATRGSDGGNASGATAGTAGTAAAVATVSSAHMMGMLSIVNPFLLPGVVGSTGGTTGAGTNVTYPSTGTPCCPGSGGAGLGIAGSTGAVGGTIFVSTASRWFSSLIGGLSTSVATTPPGNGLNGDRMDSKQVMRWFGGTGGAATHGTATGGGLVQASGGNGSIGSGGGGMGGALTGSSPGAIGLGGAGAIIFTAF